MSQIEVKNLSVSYGHSTVLSGINFSAEKGEFVAIVGKSGSGKTTFLQALAGMILFSGEISIPFKRGMVFQNYAVFPWLTVSQNIIFGLDKCSKEEAAEIVSKNLQLAHLEEKRDVYPAQLSGGQIQRVALARSLAHDPDVLLMDEPYGALDAYTRDQMQEWLLDIWMKQRKTIVFVTHNIEEAIFLADRVVIIKDGRFTKEFNAAFHRPRREDLKFTSEFNRLKKNILDSMISS